MTCDHDFKYLGVRFCDGCNTLPGTGARCRYYAHVYYCRRCLTKRSEEIRDPGGYRPMLTTYDKPRFGATPGSADECCVPLEDRP